MMKTEKKYIAQCFNRALDTYEQHCTLQKKICKQLIKDAKPYLTESEHIVDLGCGVGVSTQLLSQFACKQLIGIDLADKLIGRAKIRSNIPFVVADFEEILFSNHSIDLFFANMAMHWNDLPKTLYAISQQLKNKGIFAFSLTLKNSFPEIEDEKKNIFLSADEVLKQLKEHNFKILKKCITVFKQEFVSHLEAVKSLKNVGANLNCQINQKKGLYTEHALNNIFKVGASISLTYHIGLFVVRKEEIHVD